MKDKDEYNYNVVDPERTGKFIKDIRLYHNMTQDDLAELLFITRKAVSKWETGAGYPSIDVAKRLCNTFGISFEELIAGKYIDKNKRLAFNSSVFSLIIILGILFFTLYKDYLNKFDIYKYSFQSKSINIVNNKLMLSKNHKVYSFGSITINDNTVPKNVKLKLNLFLKDNKTILLYSCIYKNNKCHKTYSNTSISKNKLTTNLTNIFLTVTYKDTTGKVVTLAEDNLKINDNGNNSRKVLPKKNFIEPYNSLIDKDNKQLNPLLYRLENNIKISKNNKTIDLSFLYNMTKDELYKRYNGKEIVVEGKKYIISVDKNKGVINIYSSKNYFFILNTQENAFIIISGNNWKIAFIKTRRLFIADERLRNNLIVLLN